MILSRFVNINLSHCLSKFELISLAQLKDIILHLKLTTSLYDVLRLFKEVVDTIGPIILSIINISIFYGTVPSGFKHAIIEPDLKKMGKKEKENLDPQDFQNFRLISKLPFMNTILKKVAHSHPDFLTENNNGYFSIWTSFIRGC